MSEATIVEPSEILWVPIQVTEVHIANGKQGMCGSCPVALSINELLVDSVCANVFPDEIEFRRQDSGHVYYYPLLTGEPSQKISRFDFNGRMEPFMFMFPIPAHLLKPEIAQAAKQLEIERARVMLERDNSKCGLTKAEEFEQAAMRG